MREEIVVGKARQRLNHTGLFLAASRPLALESAQNTLCNEADLENTETIARQENVDEILIVVDTRLVVVFFINGTRRRL